MTLPTARENAVNTWGTPSSVPDDDKVKILSVHHATQATEQRDKDIAKELREIMTKTRYDEYGDSISKSEMIEQLIEQLDGEKVTKDEN